MLFKVYAHYIWSSEQTEILVSTQPELPEFIKDRAG
jgi:hypothetical protein